MTDNDIIALVIRVLRTGLDSKDLQAVRIKQKYQPRDIGIPTGPVIYLHKISADRYGFPGRKDVYNETNGNFDHTESIWRTPVYQVDALSPNTNPADLTIPTPSDIVETAADILQLSSTRDTLLADGVGIQRIITIRQNYFTDDRGRYEAAPSFDFTLSYRRQWTTTAPPVDSYILNAESV